MADFYDVNRAIQHPDFVGAGQQGYKFGQSQRVARQAQADDTALRALAPQIIAGDPNAMAQAGAIDPQRAAQYDDVGTAQLRKLKGFINYIDQAKAAAQKTGNMQLVNAALAQGGQFLSAFTGGKPPPTQWTPDMEPGWEALKAQVATLGQPENQRNSVVSPGSAVVDPQTGQVIYERPFTPRNQSIEQEGPDGRTRRYTFDALTNTYKEATLDGDAASGPAAGLPATPGATDIPAIQNDFRTIGERNGFAITSMERPVMPGVGAGANSQHPNGTAVDYRVTGKTPEQIAALKRDLSAAGYEVIDESDGRTGTGPHIHAELPPNRSNLLRNSNAVVAGPSAFVSRRPEDEAAAVAQAKGNVELGMLPESERIKRESAIQQSVGIETGKMAAEKAAAAPATIATLQNSLDSIDALLADPDLGDIVGLGSLNPLNRVPGTKARGLIARADQIAGQSFLAAFNQLKGGGAITEREGQAATQAIARLDRSQSIADYKQALTDLRTAIRPGLARAQQQAAGGQARPAASPERRARNPQTGEVLVLRNGQWVPE